MSARTGGRTPSPSWSYLKLGPCRLQPYLSRRAGAYTADTPSCRPTVFRSHHSTWAAVRPVEACGIGVLWTAVGARRRPARVGLDLEQGSSADPRSQGGLLLAVSG